MLQEGGEEEGHITFPSPPKSRMRSFSPLLLLPIDRHAEMRNLPRSLKKMCSPISRGEGGVWENVDGTQLEKGGGVERGERSEQCESEVPNWIILVRTIRTLLLTQALLQISETVRFVIKNA